MNTTDIVNSLRVEADMLFNSTYSLTMKQAADKLEELERHIAELKEKNAGLALACLLECPPNDDLRRGVWKNRAEHNDYIWSECSECGFIEEAWKTVNCGIRDSDYVSVKWNFCPKCGAIMRV